MRPLRLKLKGFTSFRDEAAIDFTDLDLFALWGPTGSGKSSLLDAMTYALYGKVERLDDSRESIAQLVSQGQPRMVVTLDIRVGTRDFRITRSTTAAGASKALLEKFEAGEWVTYGPGADKIREANKIVIDLVGLDYDAFTRSVLLPQGKFAEFLVGEAKDRRDILTELLGLKLFDRMQKRANEIARDETSAADHKDSLIAREYADVTPESLETARAALDALLDRSARTTALATEVAGRVRRWEKCQRDQDALVACSRDIEEYANLYSGHAADLAGLARATAEFSKKMKGADDAVDLASRAAEEAQRNRSEAEEHGGTIDTLARLATQADSLVRLRSDGERARRSLDEAKDEAARLQDDLSRLDEAIRAAEVGLAEAEATYERAGHSLHEAEHADKVGALVHDLATGDPCPVCERPLETIPPADGGALDTARAELTGAESAKKEATSRARELGRKRATMLERARGLDVRVKDGASSLEQVASRTAEVEKELLEAFAAGIPEDPVSDLEVRRAELRGLLEQEQKALQSLERSRSDRSEIEEQHQRAATGVAHIRTAMTSSKLDGALDRVRAATTQLEIELIPASPPPEAASELADEAERIAKGLQSLRDDLDDELRRLALSLKDEIEQTRAELPHELGITTSDPAQMEAGVRRAAGDLERDAALAARAAVDLERRLECRRALEDEIAEHRERRAVHRALAAELKSDRIVQFLQAEALGVLAVAATEHLRTLSDERYRLSYQEDRFWIVDAWNGDERRNVRTLSGGETFLTSLALALALSEQIQLLAVTEKRRLESLFLDEGFGSLDAESLEVVVDAIEQLRSDDRLVGVITHVGELAERMPVRLEVIKSPRGSTLRRATSPIV